MNVTPIRMLGAAKQLDFVSKHLVCSLYDAPIGQTKQEGIRDQIHQQVLKQSLVLFSFNVQNFE